MNNWFSQTPEAISEQELLVFLITDAGYDILDIVGNRTSFTYQDAKNIILNSSAKAWKDNKPYAKSGFKNEKDFQRKMSGNFSEYLFDAVVNSRRFEPLLPANWAKSKHRSEFNIPDLSRGSPDRVIFDHQDKLYSLCSVKSVPTRDDIPKNLERADYWANNEAEHYASSLGIDPDVRIRCSLFTNGKNARDNRWRGGYVSSDCKGNSIEDLLDCNTPTTLNFFRDFFAEFCHNVRDAKAKKILLKNKGKTPDDFQRSKVCDPVISHFGAGIVNAPCGIGKTVMQLYILPKTRSINLYMSGARNALAVQVSAEMTIDIGVEHHRVYVMSKMDLDQVGRNKRDELTHRVQSDQELAFRLFEYTRGGDSRPLYIISLEQSLSKVPAALKIIIEGRLINPDTNEIFDWCNDDEKIKYWSNRLISILGDAHFDEAHNLVTGDLKNKDEEDTKRKTRLAKDIIWMNKLFHRSIFWTATLKLNGSHYDMSNEAIFGKIVSVIRPKEAVDRGYVVPPLLLPMIIPSGVSFNSQLPVTAGDTKSEDSKKRADKELTYYILALEDAYLRSKELKIPCRIIIFTSDTSYHPIFRQRITEHFESKGISIWCDWVDQNHEPEERSDLFMRFGTADFGVLMNYGIVSEGINIPSCNGVILGRYMNSVNVIQASCRGSRLSQEDRKNIAEGKTKAGSWADYIKPYSFVYLLHEEDDADSSTNALKVGEIIEEMLFANDGDPWWITESNLELIPRGLGKPVFQNTQTIDNNTRNADYINELAKAIIIDPKYLHELFKEKKKKIEEEQKLKDELDFIRSLSDVNGFLDQLGYAK